MKVKVGARTDIGRLRERNEDSYLVQDSLFAVADGMGGHRGGAVASSMAMDALKKVADSEEGLSRLVEEIKKANRVVLERGESDRDLRGMGTTLTVLMIEGDSAHVAHVGDSRAYLLRDGALQQITEDHTLVQRMVREGRLSEDEAEHHPQRSILTRALGVEEDVTVDEFPISVRLGDRILLCSDGLTSMVPKDRIHEVLETEGDPQAACDLLVEEANRGGGEDNITVIVLDFVEGDGRAERGAGAARAAAVGTGPSGESKASSGGERATMVTSPPRSGVAAGPGGLEAPVFRPPEARAPEVLRRWRRALAGAAVVALLVAGALIGLRVYVDHQWYVGEAGGRVAIYQGIPTRVLWFELSHVKEATNLSAAQAEQLYQWRTLAKGITAGSREEAENIVNQIRRDLSRTGASP